MKILIFEFATAMGLQDPSISIEGKAMLEGILFDLSNIKESCEEPEKSIKIFKKTGGNFETPNIDYLISKDSQISYNGPCRPVTIKEDIQTWLNLNINEYDACLPIAPEEDFILYELTKMVEDKGVEIIGSSSKAVMACSDKFKTYNLLNDNLTIKNSEKNLPRINTERNLPLINTERVFFEDVEKYRGIFDEKPTIAGEPALDGQLKVVKPAEGVSCSGVQLVDSFQKFIEASRDIKKSTKLPYFLLQDFVTGKSASVSLLSNGKTALPLSLNSQEVSIKEGKIVYHGGKVPLEHELTKKALKMAKRVVESIDGLKGYVGVDLILNDDVNIVEVNSRLTTSYVALRNILNFNLGEALINSIHGELPPEVILKGTASFKKEGDCLKVDVI